MKASHLRRAYL